MLAKIRKLLGKAVDIHDTVSQEDVGMHLVPDGATGKDQPVVVVLLLGLDAHTMQGIIEQTRADNDASPVPIYVIDTLDFDMFTQAGEIFEHVPSAETQNAYQGPLPWDRYLESRLELLLAKWRPLSIIPFGSRSHDVLTAWELARKAQRQMTEGSR